MTEERWKDDELPRGLGAALRDARDDVPSEHEVAALEARVLAAIAAGAAGGGGGGAGAAAAKAKATGAALTTGSSVGTVVAAVVVGLSVVGLVAYRNASPAEPLLEATTPAPAATVEVAEPEPEVTPEPTVAPEPAEVETPAEPAPARARGPRAEPVPEPAVVEVVADEAVADEAVAPPVDALAILFRAQRLLRSDPAAALAALAPLEGPGSWAEDRERIAIEALARLDRITEARARFAEFVTDYPSSAYRVRLEELLAR